MQPAAAVAIGCMGGDGMPVACCGSSLPTEMETFLMTLQRKGDPVDLKRLKDNIALMKKWATEGK